MRDGGLKREDGLGAAALRLFVAISLPDAVEEEIEKVQQEMRKEFRGNFMRWTKREQFHLTLKFLGNVAAGRVGELSESLREACVAFGGMRLCAGRVGFFPDARFPRVMWVGVRDERDELSRLQEKIELRTERFAEDMAGPVGRRRSQAGFVGHVTLARIQGIRPRQAESLSKLAEAMAERFFGEWVADKVELIRSELSSAGSRYTTVETFPLLGNRD